ncbi:phthiocerol/phenolphthiocerol synthesis type-I polyketide synthase D [Thermomonospora echinospora]|uniref:Phthiocerol/phenolphthiocerol synthesis type-I polyketide synthase D n=1 Tax=Thermomonospora echinospora TaxID=1992 RepID=A0A1H6CCX1_9ACTN|nr:type I polyketide synthase [Thermomonospora echinospora]SEG70748.1 phthiocerol/phenolphthiocerol synthesis type-I polyketide synthase D [Thermomonospora echinospora]
MQSNDRSGVAPDETRITEDSVRQYLIEQIARRSRITAAEVDPDRPVEEFGLASRDAVAIAGELEQLLGRALPATLVWEHPTINGLATALAGGQTAPAPVAPPARDAAPDEPIAVIGIGCRFPGGARGDLSGPQAYWRFLLGEGDAIREVPDGRWDAFDDGSPEVGDLLARTTRLGGFLDDLAGFDARFFGITPGEAQLMDPQQRLVLEVAWEAFEHAGLAPARLRGTRTGVFVGVSAPEYAAFTASDLTLVEPFTTTGAALSIIANRLSYLLDLRGPSMIVDTACSSSLVSAHLAVRALRAGDADVALAGGVNLLLSPTVTMTFDQGGGTSPDGRCKAFDASADGMVRAEGCGAVVLKRLSDAVRDGDRVLAVIRGTGVNSDGRSNGLVAPNSEAQKALLREVYAACGVDPREVDYVEAHGTGTFLGDPIEARALGEVLGAGGGRAEDEPLLIGSAKSNLGHMESAAGIAGLIKAVLALHHRTIPPSLHFKEPNPHIPFEEMRLAVTAEETPWPRRGHPARAGVSGFGFGGTNAHVILEEAPPRQVPSDSALVRSFPLSDTAADRIPAHAADLAAWVEANEDVPLGDLAHTLHRRGGRGRARAAVVARDRAGLRDGLNALAAGEPHPSVVSGTALGMPRPPVWVFSGYGAQRPEMARRLLQEESAFTEAIDDIDPLMQEEGGFSLWEFIESGEAKPHPAHVMMALFGIQVGLARMWASYGVTPAAVVGHSMGEIAAAVVAGKLTLEDGVKVICRRTKLMLRLVGGGAMAMLGASEEEVRALAHDLPDVYPAVFSSPRQTVVTGDADQIAAIVERAEAEGRLARMVKAEGAGHSPQTEPLLPELREALADIAAEEGTPLAPGIAFYSTALEDPRAAGTLDADYWAANLRNPVRLTGAVSAAADDGHRTFVEVNAHPILAAALTETLEGTGALVTHTLKRAPKGQPTDDTLTFHAQLATLTANGYQTAEPAGSVIELPPARWWHEHHWAEPAARRSTGRDEHPLLGAHVELPGEDRHAWRGDVGTAAQPWIAATGVHGLTVLPPAALAEMALAAGAHALGTGDVRVNSLWMERPLALGEHATVTTTFNEADQRVEIHALSAAGRWTRLASADVGPDHRPPGDGPAGPVIDVAAASAGAGPRQGVGASTRGSRHYRVHPEVFGRCLAALYAEAAVVETGTWLAETIGSLRVHGPTHRGGHCQVSVVHDDEVTGALRLLSPEGDVLIEATGITLRKVERADIPVPLADKLVELVWDETGAPDPSATEGTWLVLAGDGDAFADALDAGLRARGGHVVRHALTRRPPDDHPPMEQPPTGVVLVPSPDLVDEELVLMVAGVSRSVPDGTRLWVATREALPVRDGEAGHPRQGFVRALTRVLGFERASLKATLVDVDDPAALVTELLGDADATEVAWRDGVRRVARLDRAALPDSGDTRPRRVVRRGGAYVITGGYGGIGLVVARLLAERGAGRIVLSGRGGPGPDAEKVIAELRESGVDVGVVLGDIAAPGVAERLVSVAVEGGERLRGVVHGAAGLDDRLIADLGADDLHRVWSPKVAGAWRLHEALQEAGAEADLDFFVVHSSAAALLGSPGQASYAAANAALDALVAWRRAHGLTGTTVNWGTWSQVGGAAELSVTVLDPISPQEGAEALEALLAHDRAATGVLRFDPATAVDLFPEIRRLPYFAALVAAADAGDDDTADWPGVAALREMDADAARAAIAARVRHRIASVLGYPPERLDPATPLTDLGIDSLVAVRIKSGVEHDLGLTVPAALLLQGASIDAIEDWAAGELGIGERTGPRPSAVSNAEAGYVMPRDAAERLAVRIFEDVLGLERVSVTADFFELGGDDHRADQVVAALARELGGDLNRSQVLATPTAEGVAALIRAVDEEAARQTVRPLRPGRPGRLPIFIAHPAGGTTACYRQLAALLGDDQPVFGLERFDDAPSVEERAARYVEHLVRAQPEGPFRLAGWSFGGVLAYETARQLTAAGREVELVALFDAGIPHEVEDEADTLARRFAAFADYLNETYGLGAELRYEELAGRSEEDQFALVMERAAGLAELLPPAVLHHQLTSHQDTRSLEAYRPQPYDGRVVLYRAPEETPWAVKDARYVPDPTNRFGPYCAGLEIVTIAGAHHLNLLDPPAVDVVAAHLAQQLATGAPETPGPDADGTAGAV